MTRVAVLIIGLFSASLLAQAPNFAGTWKMDTARSRVTPSAGLIGLIGAGAPATLHVTQPANGTLVIESQINEGHVRIYVPSARSSTPAGQGGSITMLTRWEGSTLVSEGSFHASSGDMTTVREAIALDADGRSLTIDVTTTTASGANASTLVYTRIHDVGPCESWPTPCKRAPSP